MAHISEVLPIVVDPNHERFGQIGEMTFSGASGDGTCIIKFEDGEEAHLNDGYITGAPQFVAPLKQHEKGVLRLQSKLPDMKTELIGFTEQIVIPSRSSANKMKNIAARTGFVALINGVIFEPDENPSES